MKYTNKSIYIHSSDKDKIINCAKTLEIGASKLILCSLEYINTIGRKFVINESLCRSPVGSDAVRWGIRVSLNNVELIKKLTRQFGYNENTSAFIVDSMLTICYNVKLLEKVSIYNKFVNSFYIDYPDTQNENSEKELKSEKYPTCVLVLDEIKTKCEQLIKELNSRIAAGYE